MRSRLLRAVAASALIASFAVPSTAQQIRPQERRPAPDRDRPQRGDAEATAEACAELGFRTYGERNEYYGAVGAMQSVAPVTAQANRSMAADARARTKESRRDYTGPVPPPSPPPPPPPSVMAYASPPIVAQPYQPGPVETERYPDATTNPVKRVSEAPVSTFSIDVDTASYSNVRRFLNEGRMPPRNAVRVEELINYFDYDYPLPQARSEPFRPFVAVTPSPWSEGKRIVHIGLQGYELPRAERPPLNLVFLVDVSGSMNGPDRLQLAQQSLNLLIDQLRPQDHVSMVVYAGAAGAVLEPTPGTQKLKMRCAVNALQAGGSTAGSQGLELAYQFAQRNFQSGAANRVILMTDGDFNVGINDPEKLEDFISDKRRTGVYLSIYGYGRGNYNDALMQTLAQNGNGTAAYIDSLQEGRKVFRDDFEHGLFPIADDVKIQVEFNPRQVSEYRLIGYETRLLNREDFNNDRIDAGEVGSGASVTALYEITPTGQPGSVDPLRYQDEARPTPGLGGELAFLRVRYKLPGQSNSRLMERPITEADAFRGFQSAPAATRWAIAVASWGQKLRGDPWIPDQVGWNDVLAMAGDRRGEGDPRGEFSGLVRRSSELGAVASASR
jgi:Ca-activated chloride channel family protein